MQTHERRRDPRASFGMLFLNKYIEGFPHLAGLVEMSASGMLVRKIHEPRSRERNQFHAAVDNLTVEMGQCFLAAGPAALGTAIDRR